MSQSTHTKPQVLILHAILWIIASAVASGLAGVTTRAIVYLYAVSSGKNFEAEVVRFQILGTVSGFLGSSTVQLLAARAEIAWKRMAPDPPWKEGKSFTKASGVALLTALISIAPILFFLIEMHLNTPIGTAIRRSPNPPLPDTLVMLPAFGIFAPVANELFFRGWLWRGLRRDWGFWRTLGTTSAMGPLFHLVDGWHYFLLAVAVAILLGLARELDGSVRLPIVLNVTYSCIAWFNVPILEALGAF